MKLLRKIGLFTKKKLNSVENFAKIQTFGHYVYNLARLEKKILPQTKENMALLSSQWQTFYNFSKIHLSNEKKKKKSLFFFVSLPRF